MYFGILGPVEVRTADGRSVPPGGPQLRALLALLLLDAGREVGTGRLIEGLYGDSPPGNAANALQSQVSRLRRVLRAAGPPGPHRTLVESGPVGYRLAVDPDAVDAYRFTRLARAGRTALAAGDPARAVHLLTDALDRWRGAALADVADAPFAAAPAARLEELRLTAVEDRAEAVLALGERDGPIAELRDLVAAHPLRERPRGQLMRALSGAGRTADALAVYADLRRVLAEELGTEPSAELAMVHLAVLRGEPVTSPARPAAPASVGPLVRAVAPASVGPPAAPAPVPLGAAPESPAAPVRPALPAPVSSFVGRVDELAHLGRLLDTARLVTVTGPGGVGKTRLCVEVASRRPDEICFVGLAPLTDGDQVAPAVLAALGLREAGLTGTVVGPSASDSDLAARSLGRLVTALTGRRILLVLDNCEHLVAGAARLAAALLGACPDLRILTTSREPLGITGELLHPLAPLDLPPATVGTAPDPDLVLRSAAVRLFVDRATAVRPDFAVDAGNVATVVRVCTALDGLPLAIELAAVRLRALPLDEVAARLDDRFRLLTRGDRTVLPRHRTLRAVVEWSWDLLTGAERRLARRLTVFAGGATLAAIEQVCAPFDAETGSVDAGTEAVDAEDTGTHSADAGDTGIDTVDAGDTDAEAVDVADLLAGLVDRSLVEIVDGRYRMLETIRAFGAERLTEAGEAERYRRAHAGHLLGLARVADPWLRRAEQITWLSRLAAEHRNLQAALRWAVHADPHLALRLVGTLSAYWHLRGSRSEVAPLAAELLRAVGDEPPPGLTEEYVLCLFHAAYAVGVTPDLLDRAGRLVAGLPGPPRQPYLLVFWAQLGGPPGGDAADRAWLIGPEPWPRALHRFGTGFLRLFQGELSAAEAELRPALAGFRSVGDRWGTAQVLDALAWLADRRGDRAASLALTDEALDLVGQLGAGEEVAELSCRRGDRLRRAGDLAGARADYVAAAGLAARFGLPLALAQARSGIGTVDRLAGDLASARSRQEQALAACADGWLDSGIRVRALGELGRIAEAQGNVGSAHSRHAEAVRTALGLRNLLDVADAAEGLAGAVLLGGDPAGAAWLLGVTEALRGPGVPGDPDLARVVAGARARLGPAGYAEAFGRGVSAGPTAGLAALAALVGAAVPGTRAESVGVDAPGTGEESVGAAVPGTGEESVGAAVPGTSAGPVSGRSAAGAGPVSGRADGGVEGARPTI
ncbi:AfsR/SARP family transcriptional regulator [Micromonospora echinofusca]|uniref:AfsR/SARP family transcriptional regulator n=1 Tax=Micromonospora echinofusca TaxID=47858 RepID=UPI0027DD4E3D|nr:BTAD domain-containing putative transcriptional regulator [Micromonospora echinofusca]